MLSIKFKDYMILTISYNMILICSHKLTEQSHIGYILFA